MIGHMRKRASNAAYAVGLYFHLAGLAKDIFDQTEVGGCNQGVDAKLMMLYIEWIATTGRDMTFFISYFHKMLASLRRIQGQISSSKGKVNTKKFLLTEDKLKGRFPRSKVDKDLVGHILESAFSIYAVMFDNYLDNFINNEFACKVGNKTLRVIMNLE